VRPDPAVPHARKRNPYRRTGANRQLEGSAPMRDDRALQSHVQVRKAVFPVAGLDTGLLPATKAAPKEMLTIVDKPLIHYAVEEAATAGIREMIFVTNRNKRAIEDHFDMAYELEATLANEDRTRELEELQRLFPPDVRYLYVRQREYTGLGSALRCARPLVGEESFALILPDQLIDSEKPAIAQLLDTFHAARQTTLTMRCRWAVRITSGCTRWLALRKMVPVHCART
jgi:UTP-glucose-1-phosphate uridylyltransferase